MSRKHDFGFNRMDLTNGPEKKADTFLQHGPRDESPAYHRGRVARRKEHTGVVRIGHKLVPYTPERD